jgi:NAD(P)H dehydrogenase (quinone)
MDEVAGYISAALGTRVEYHGRTEAQQRAVLQSAGLPELPVDVLLGVDALTRDNLYAMPSPTVFELTGHPPMFGQRLGERTHLAVRRTRHITPLG